MTQRRYTLDEIDQMRDDMTVITFPNGDKILHSSHPEGSQEMEYQDRKIEDNLRTAMLAGVDPADLAVKAAPIRKSWEERRDVTEATYAGPYGRAQWAKPVVYKP